MVHKFFTHRHAKCSVKVKTRLLSSKWLRHAKSTDRWADSSTNFHAIELIRVNYFSTTDICFEPSFLKVSTDVNYSYHFRCIHKFSSKEYI